MIRRTLGVALLLLVSSGCVTAPPARVGALRDDLVLGDDARDANLRSFDEIWTRVANSYYDADRLRPPGAEPAASSSAASSTVRRVNWPGVRDAYRPRVERAVTQGAARAAMGEALAQLGETHFAILPAELYAAEGQASFQSTDSEVGLTLRLMGNEAIVTRVDAGSSAAQAGVHAGWILSEVEGEAIGPLIDRLRGLLPANRMAEAKVLDHLGSLVNPGVGKRARATFLDGTNRRRRVVLVGRPSQGEVTRLGNLPPMVLRVDARRLPGDVAYFSCGVFLDPTRVLGAFADLIATNPEARGLVIDLRGNPGGLGSMASALCGFLVTGDDLRLGTMIRRDGPVPMVIYPRLPRFAGPVATLVDGMSMSTSEIFARGMQDLRRGRVFGQPTPGAALPSVVVRLPNGDRFQYATADYVSVGGTRLEGVGVTPDETIELGRATLLAGGDPTLDAALRWIAQQPTTSPATVGNAARP